MLVSLTLVRYRTIFIPFAFLAMALHRIPLFFTKGCSFWKLLGCGKNGSFDLTPDLNQWGLLAVWRNEESYWRFKQHSVISKWWRYFGVKESTVLLQPLSAHGKWSGKEPFGKPKNKTHQGQIAVLTRATIRFNRLKNFWKNVSPVAEIMRKHKGFISSVGIGEAPFFMQATFSIWESTEDMVQFAYKDEKHAEVIKRTRDEAWYAEELFARFAVISISGELFGSS
ncbi:DUF3291 domain-containing protein [Pelobium manganitolerans]|uniref:DUF3291 domain-containing protein n=1 Tax=Pelobium manganitolerans TaxID=1842495 RepID=A0A419S377_9SPHI|nr:DUF3291 domain-containing protein [Pelobium manganitolerans]RKD13734.1 DUF3291 domain-containing protein [Pelobium manganitolerans]